MAAQYIYLPAIQGQIGDWVYYVVTMTFAELTERVISVDSLKHEKQGMKTWLQRSIDKKRVDQIRDYLLREKERFFNSIVVGIYGGNPEWFPVEVSSGVLHKDIVLPQRLTKAFGIVRLSGEEQIFAIDGQHRVEGLRKLISDHRPDFPNDEVTLMMVAHGTDTIGHSRSRRLFSTLNRYAVKVSLKDQIALSEDDAFARAVRKMLEDYSSLNEELVGAHPATNIPSSDGTSFISVVGLYQALQKLSGYESRKLKQLKHKSSDADVRTLFDLGVEFFDALKTCVPPVKETLDGKGIQKDAARYRNKEGGHVLFRPELLVTFAEVVAILKTHGNTTLEAVKIALKCPMELDKDPWVNIKWNPTKKVIIGKNLLLSRNIILTHAGKDPVPADYDVTSERNKLIP